MVYEKILELNKPLRFISWVSDTGHIKKGFETANFFSNLYFEDINFVQISF